MSRRDIVVVGASAGGVEALMRLASGLPKDLPASLFVVLHVPASGTSVLPSILSRAGPIAAKHAENHELIEPGRIYIAPPDRHLLLHRGYLRLLRGPAENGHRPAIDPLFRSAAWSYGPRVTGVVLSGTRDDGTAGLIAIKSHHGVAIVQDPEEALFAGMPKSALENVTVDHCLRVDEIAQLLAKLVHEAVPDSATGHVTGMEADETEELEMAELNVGTNGKPTRFTCPLCHGSLAEITEGELIRYKCRVGHAFSPESLLDEQTEALEAAFWSALNALGERASMARRMAMRARQRGHALSAERFENAAREADEHAGMIQRLLMNGREFVQTGLGAESNGNDELERDVTRHPDTSQDG